MLAQNYTQVIEKIHNACEKAQREIDSVTLLAVSKFHSAQSVAEVAMLGQRHFAENYFQEAKQKRKEVEELLPEEIYKSLQWHSTGHIQTNKAKEACNDFTLLHTVDSQKLARALNKVLEQKLQVQDMLIEVNVGDEEQKAGVRIADCAKLIEEVLTIPTLRLQGFMCLPPFQTQVGENRKYFNKLYDLKQKMETEFNTKFPHLSMGTSSDFVEAIFEGATIVRVGTDIFGERVYTKD